MKKSFLLFPLVALVLAACGDDSSSSSEDDNGSSITYVGDFDDLVHCTKSHYGELAHVRETDSTYVCTSDGWVAADSSEIEDILSGSSASKDDSSDESSNSKSSSSVSASSSETEKIEKKEVKSVSVTGLAQVGPYASGSTVTVYGLDSVLATTKTKFTGKTSNDSGRFEVSSISLDNQYAQIEVYGFFMNMMTGVKTSGTRTKLHAIVDLSSSDKVKANVNLFTELEQARVTQLVLKEKFNVPAAKVRATREILNMFGVKAPEGLTATAISLADTTEVGAALYAAMVMMQADLSISKFGSRVAEIAEDFAADGLLDDEELRAAIADFLSEEDGDDGFASIRTNMKSSVSKVPDFESLLEYFWTEELGLGACTDSLETTIVKVKNKNSAYSQKGFACTSKRWHLSSDLDTELGLCTAKMEGEFKESNLAKTPKYYSCVNGSWKEISQNAYELKSCTDERKDEYAKTESGEMFVCLDKQWKEVDAVTYELKFCTESRKDEVKKTQDGKFYGCLNEEWVEVDESDFKVGYPCLEHADTLYEKVDDKYYKCNSKNWVEITEEMFEIGLCSGKNAGTCEKGISGKYYQCVEEKEEYIWADYDEVSCKVGECNASFKDHNAVYEGNGYYCDGKIWNACNSSNVNALLDGYACVDSTDGENRFYAWRPASEYEMIGGGVCNKNLEIAANDNDDKWVYYSNHSKAIYCMDECKYSQCMEGIHLYEWVNASEIDVKTGMLCQLTTVDVLKNGYVCEQINARTFEWREADATELAMGKVCAYDNMYSVEGDYACDYNEDSQRKWRVATGFEKDAGAVCSSSKNGKTVTSAKSIKYTCHANANSTKYYWVAIIGGYEAVEIGSQVWRTTNSTNSYGKIAWTGDPEGENFGFYYTFSSAQSACPSPWRLPTKEDVDELKAFFGNNKAKVANGLIDASDWHLVDLSNNPIEVVGTNDYGFSAKPAGSFYDCTELTSAFKQTLCGGKDYSPRVENASTFDFWTSDGGSVKRYYDPGDIDIGYYGTINYQGNMEFAYDRLGPDYTKEGNVQYIGRLLPVRCILQ